MPLLIVTNGPTPPNGLTLTRRTSLVVELSRPYSDGSEIYPTRYEALYDPSTGGWKPKGTQDGTPFRVPGAGPDSPTPPKVKLIETQEYEGAESVRSIRRVPGIFETAAGEWNYGSNQEE